MESFLKKGGGGFFSNSVIPEIASCWNNFSAVSSLTLAVFKQRLTTTCQECCRGDSGLKRGLVNVDDYQVSSNWRTLCFTPSRANWDEKMEDFRASVWNVSHKVLVPLPRSPQISLLLYMLMTCFYKPLGAFSACRSVFN